MTFRNACSVCQVDVAAWTPVPLLSTLLLHDNEVDGTLNSTRLSGLGQLTTLRIDKNRLSALAPDAFRLLPSLRRLNVAGNRIPELPGGVFAENSQLEEVIIIIIVFFVYYIKVLTRKLRAIIHD